MDQQWTGYAESPATSRQPSTRYAPHTMAEPQQQQRDLNLPSNPPKSDPYASPTVLSRSGSMALNSPTNRPPNFNDGDGDVPMEDADPYNNKPKYGAQRPNHQHRHSQQFVQQEASEAARRYSPMNLSPQSPYSGSAPQGAQGYTSFSPQAQNNNRQSPTRSNPYMSPPNSYYSPPTSRPHVPQLPPLQSTMNPESFYPQSATAQLNAVYNREARSPRVSNPPPQLPPIGRGPVPKFQKCTNTPNWNRRSTNSLPSGVRPLMVASLALFKR